MIQQSHSWWKFRESIIQCACTPRGFPSDSDGKESTHQCRRPRFDPSVWKILWRRKWQPTPAFFSGKSYGQRNLMGHSPWGCKRAGQDLAPKQYQQRCTPKFTTALSTIARTCKQPKCPSAEECIKKMGCVCVYIYTHTMEYYPTLKK